MLYKDGMYVGSIIPIYVDKDRPYIYVVQKGTMSQGVCLIVCGAGISLFIITLLIVEIVRQNKYKKWKGKNNPSYGK